MSDQPALSSRKTKPDAAQKLRTHGHFLRSAAPGSAKPTWSDDKICAVPAKRSGASRRAIWLNRAGTTAVTFPNLPFIMNFLPLLLTASLCLLFSLAVYFLRERLQQPRRSPVSPAAGNDLPFDRQA
jgi:hypothetical protein